MKSSLNTTFSGSVYDEMLGMSLNFQLLLNDWKKLAAYSIEMGRSTWGGIDRWPLTFTCRTIEKAEITFNRLIIH